nr:type III-B CRISPR module RAMP protein Cmr1 [Candidatus Freyrarchaeum guaymaensis]
MSLTVDQLARSPETFLGEAERDVSSRVDGKLIATVKFENITPTVIGGYNAATGSLELELAESVRVTEIKGLWRWWARALLLGCKGRQSWNLADEVRRRVAELLGSTEKPGKAEIRLAMETDAYKLFKKRKDQLQDIARTYSLEKINKIISKSKGETPRGSQPADYSFQKLAESIPRTRIIAMGVPYTKKEIERRKKSFRGGQIPDSERKKMVEENAKVLTEKLFVFHHGELKGEIKVYESLRGNVNLTDAERNFLVGSLLVALTFGGLGAITARGFGAVSLSVSVKRASREFERVTGKIFKGVDVEENLKRLVELTLNYGRRLIGGAAQAASSIPKYSSADPNNAFRVEVVNVNAGNSFELLEKIGRATLKSEWKRVKGFPLRKKGGCLHTWILGLPRMRLGKGYYYKGRKSESRRRSAVYVRPLVPPGSGRGRWIVAIYGFLSEDWNVESLYHQGIALKKVKEYPVTGSAGSDKPMVNASDDRFIKEVFHTAFCFVKRLLR